MCESREVHMRFCARPSSQAPELPGRRRLSLSSSAPPLYLHTCSPINPLHSQYDLRVTTGGPEWTHPAGAGPWPVPSALGKPEVGAGRGPGKVCGHMSGSSSLGTACPLAGLTFNSDFFSKALAITLAASTPTVLPSRRRASKPSKSSISLITSLAAQNQRRVS